ncbi:MAG: putative Ig domain-containing protein, partial [Gammaproteobacteria bacterium]|nr:putative Ig domain-containing protein [Gammaproteobacteria bacterium]
MFNNRQTRLYRALLVGAFLLVPAIWVAASMVASTFEQVNEVNFHTQILSTTAGTEIIRVRVKNKSEHTITGSFRLVIEEPGLPFKNAAGITDHGKPYFLFKKGEIFSVLPGGSIRTRISNKLFNDDEEEDDSSDEHDELSSYNFRLERRITPSHNNQPSANAGIDQFRVKGDLVYLDGSQSYDLDGERLAYHWVLEGKPDRSLTTLVNADTVNPYFKLDVNGRYIFALYVNDGTENSHYDRVVIKTRNVRPVAQAGNNRLVVPGDIVQLDGSASSDVNGDALSYTWVLETSPTDSIAALDNAHSVQPKLTIDSAGQYIVKLKVNDGRLNSLPDRVIISDTNLAPVANAGADQATVASAIIQLDASASYALDAQPLTYTWSLVTAPDNSVSSLSDAHALKPALLIDQPGDYVIQLIVNDGARNSLPDHVIVSTNNVRPVANAGEAQDVLLNSQVQLNAINSFDGDGDLLAYQWSMLHKPETSAATLANVNGILTDFIADVSGQYVVQLVANDGQLESYADTVVITADTAVNQPPTIQSTPVVTAQTKVLYSYAVSATDEDGDTLTYALIQSPAGMIIDSTSGLITWAPGAPDAYPVTVQVSDGQGGEVTQPFTVIVEQLNVAPIIQSTPIFTGLTNTLYSYSVMATDDNGDALTYRLTQSATGMIIDSSSGLITWTPSASGSFPVTVVVSDGRGGEGTQSFVVIVEPLNQSPVIQSAPVISAQTDVAYSYQVIASDANGDSLAYSLTQSPAGMSINTVSGLISWTSTVTGSFPVTVQVSDGRAGVDEQLFVVTVTQSNRPPVITSAPVAQATIDQPYTYQVIASDVDANVLTYRLLAAPLGMNINASSGVISWLPANFETSNVNIEVDDGKTGKATQLFTVSSKYPADNQPPVFAPLADRVVVIGTKFSLQLNAQDPEGKTIRYAIAPLPLPA